MKKSSSYVDFSEERIVAEMRVEIRRLKNLLRTTKRRCQSAYDMCDAMQDPDKRELLGRIIHDIEMEVWSSKK